MKNVSRINHTDATQIAEWALYTYLQIDSSDRDNYVRYDAPDTYEHNNTWGVGLPRYSVSPYNCPDELQCRRIYDIAAIEHLDSRAANAYAGLAILCAQPDDLALLRSLFSYCDVPCHSARDDAHDATYVFVEISATTCIDTVTDVFAEVL